MEQLHHEHSAPFLAVRHTQSAVRHAANLVAHHASVDISMIFHTSRCGITAARARQLAMYLAHVVLGESLTDIGLAFGRDRTTVSYACNLIEDMRDDVAFDREVTDLEMRLQTLAGLTHE
ncbi:MAG: helix-turn-helix domain-containing protein [Devosia sp.]